MKETMASARTKIVDTLTKSHDLKKTTKTKERAKERLKISRTKATLPFASTSCLIPATKVDNASFSTRSLTKSSFKMPPL
jgi:hypothetical protein